MSDAALDDARSAGPVERLMEDSWTTRSRRVNRRELAVESAAAILFLACAVPLALPALAHETVDVPLCAALVAMYAITARLIKFPIGAGYVVPSYIVLVPMLLLLPPGLVPLLTAAGLLGGTLALVILGRSEPERMLFAVPDAWHTLGPAAVLVAAGSAGGTNLAVVYLAAFAAGCLVDLISSTVREAAILGVRPHLQLRVLALVWLIDACVAPLGLLVAHAARQNHSEILLLLPVNGLLMLVSRDRNTRIEQAQHRLDLVARERRRLQTAVGRLGEALASRLDLGSLTEIVLRGSVEALDADAGRLVLEGTVEARQIDVGRTGAAAVALQDAAAGLSQGESPCQLERSGVWALALPFRFPAEGGMSSGSVAVARRDRPFREDEIDVITGLVQQARKAAADIVAHVALREQVLTDNLTGLGNRRRLAGDLDERVRGASLQSPLVLILFDLDGFKSYNDTFGHLAGDAVLARLGGKLAASVAGRGSAYRLGGDEFCALIEAGADELEQLVPAVCGALTESGENFAIGASHGSVLLPAEAASLDYALQLADERMYALKRSRPSTAGDQTRDVLMRIIHARQPSLQDHSSAVARLCLLVGRRLDMAPEELDELARAAELHDVGKVGVPDAILSKPESLNTVEWEFIRQHTLLGERILSAAPPLRPIAAIVRASHERWDGSGYPDGLARESIPLAARIISACDAYEAMTAERSYRSRLDDDAAREEMRRGASTQFDPRVVEVLLEVLAELARSPQDGDAGLGAGGRVELQPRLLEVFEGRHELGRPTPPPGPPLP